MSNYEDEIDHPETCEGMKPDGSRCEAPVQRGSRYCFFHDPGKGKERRDAQQRGGRANRPPLVAAHAPHVSLNSIKDIARLYAGIINLQLKGEISPKEASSLGYNLSQLSKLFELSTTEERIAAWERAYNKRLPGGPIFDPFGDEDSVHDIESES